MNIWEIFHMSCSICKPLISCREWTAVSLSRLLESSATLNVFLSSDSGPNDVLSDIFCSPVVFRRFDYGWHLGDQDTTSEPVKSLMRAHSPSLCVLFHSVPFSALYTSCTHLPLTDRVIEYLDFTIWVFGFSPPRSRFRRSEGNILVFFHYLRKMWYCWNRCKWPVCALTQINIFAQRYRWGVSSFHS